MTITRPCAEIAETPPGRDGAPRPPPSLSHPPPKLTTARPCAVIAKPPPGRDRAPRRSPSLSEPHPKMTITRPCAEIAEPHRPPAPQTRLPAAAASFRP